MIVENDATFAEHDREHRFGGMPPMVRQLGSREWKLVHPIYYRSPKHGLFIEVDEGFPFDFASTPPVVRWAYPPTGISRNPYQMAAPFHDWLYWVRHAETLSGRLVAVDRETADDVFLEAMEYLGVRWTLRRMFYRAVRMGGWVPRNRDDGREYRQKWLLKRHNEARKGGGIAA